MNNSSPLGGVIRGVVMFGVAALLLYTWLLTGVGKLRAGGVPEWFVGSFGETFLASFPGLTIAFYSIAVMEVIGGALAALSILFGEFLRPRATLFMRLALAQSLLIFVQLGFGKRLISDHDGAHDLFVYSAATLIMLVAVLWVDERSGSKPAGSAAGPV